MCLILMKYLINGNENSYLVITMHLHRTKHIDSNIMKATISHTQYELEPGIQIILSSVLFLDTEHDRQTDSHPMKLTESVHEPTNHTNNISNIRLLL